MERVGIVTDSAADLTTGEAARYGIGIVPLRIVIGGTSYAETEAGVAERVAVALRTGVPVSTSRPPPSAFLAEYRSLAGAGAQAIVSVHLSSDLSGTKDSARLAALEAPVPTAVVDSRQVTMGLGLAVLAAACSAARGASAGEVADAVRRCASATATIFFVDTVDHLRRGGRVGPARALLGSALAVKHLLQVEDGRIAVLAKVRTGGRARAELEEIAVRRASELLAEGAGGVEVAVQHLAAGEVADELATRLRRRVPGLERLVVRETGGAVGAHVGPGMLSAVIAPAS